MTIYKQPREGERLFWLFLLIYYGLSLLVLPISTFSIPIGLLIGFGWVMRKGIPNRFFKQLALLFGLVYYFIAIFVPNLTVKEAFTEKQIDIVASQLQNVLSIHTFVPVENEALSSTKPTTDDALLQLQNWVFTQRQIPLSSNVEKNNKLYQHDYIQVNNHLSYATYYIKKDNVGYTGVYYQEGVNQPYQLRYVIKHQSQLTKPLRFSHFLNY